MDLTLLAQTLDELGEPRYRAGQIWRWTARGANGFDAMTDLPVALRTRPALVAALVIAAVGTVVIGLFPQPYIASAADAFASALGNAPHHHEVLNR